MTHIEFFQVGRQGMLRMECGGRGGRLLIFFGLVQIEEATAATAEALSCGTGSVATVLMSLAPSSMRSIMVRVKPIIIGVDAFLTV